MALLPPMLFSGSSNPVLAKEIAGLLDTQLGKIDIRLFPDKEIFVEILEPVKSRHVFVIQSLFADPNIHLMELLIMIDAFKRAATASITAVIPYYGYARQDRINKPGVAITAKLIADLLTKAGADRIITLDLHAEQIEGFFDIPVEHLLSRSVLIDYCSKLNLENAIIVAPDKGGIKIAGAYSRQLEWPIALIDKERIDPLHVVMHLFVGEVAGRTVLLPDDMCSTAGTLFHAAKACAEFGAQKIIAVVGHGLFVGNALELIQDSPIETVIATNSVQTTEKVRNHPKIRIVSVASLFADAIRK
ncbi:MAG: ribose-phosphate diphosphokinase [Chlamydiales bacterium]